MLPSISALTAYMKSRRMSIPEFTTLITGLSFTECPRWRDGRLYVSDFYTHRVIAAAMDGTAEPLAHVPQQPSGSGSCQTATRMHEAGNYEVMTLQQRERGGAE